jgi:hypothetical protein
MQITALDAPRFADLRPLLHLGLHMGRKLFARAADRGRALKGELVLDLGRVQRLDSR